jgi:N-acylneuraminate cytidylyltransferase
MSQEPRVLAIVPARAGSKGIPGKNSKLLNGKPLIAYTLEYVKTLFDTGDICVSTDSQEIINIAEAYGVKAPFIRPSSLALDTSGSYEVILHALDYYSAEGKEYDAVALFQPTSPFRLKKHFVEALNSFQEEPLDMIVSVKETKSNPYYVLMEENKDGLLEKSKTGNFARRQEAPVVYEINGSIYIYDAEALRRCKSFSEFKKVRKYLMDDLYSTDIDTLPDWYFAEFLIQKGLIHFD